ncbi:hypothetical protein VPHG_00149 [Vibrio phage 11895-B1]|uniref:hypothetical protein n=1 Tax=Vibrio phage 11895-B1 TaxID=754075 RepID=UPI0002C0C805|nr:hypothetical protein VPHG_00149 [Vibrio phage 11895-B1]AGH32213.1 hypothetical protein VPHG_00149 [Vibrio phage 11895-B1]
MSETLTPEDKSKRVLNLEFKYHLPQYELNLTEDELYEQVKICVDSYVNDGSEILSEKLKEMISGHIIMVKDGWMEEIKCDQNTKE